MSQDRALPDQPSLHRLMVRTPDFQSGNRGSTPLGDTKLNIAEVTQLVEFLPSKQIVASSSLVFRSAPLVQLVEAHDLGS